jgi:glutathione synthase/RimK-type ligase-like ATP-grasp enzyme
MGVDTWWSSVRTVRYADEGIRLDAHRVAAIPSNQSRRHIEMAEPIAMAPDRFSSIQFRVDPPVDESYSHSLRLVLADAVDGRSVVNDPSALFFMTSKLAPLALKLPSPPAVVSARWEDLLDFVRVRRDVVLKPLADMQGRGVARLRWRPGSELVLRRTLEVATDSFRKPVLLQAWIETVHSEVRLWFADARLLAVVSKSRGVRVERVRMSDGQVRTGRRIAAALRRAGIRLAAVDLIDDMVIDLNFASPGLLVETERALGKNLASAIMKILLRSRRVKTYGG